MVLKSFCMMQISQNGQFYLSFCTKPIWFVSARFCCISLMWTIYAFLKNWAHTYTPTHPPPPPPSTSCIIRIFHVGYTIFMQAFETRKRSYRHRRFTMFTVSNVDPCYVIFRDLRLLFEANSFKKICHVLSVYMWSPQHYCLIIAIFPSKL